MPVRLSVVVPVYRVEEYLKQCLDSILTGDDRVEVIAVDDASPAPCGGLLDAYAEDHPGLRVLHLPHNVGLGLARNAGLDEATGDYVWFVDSDDWLAPGAVPAVLNRLRDTEPDVLLIDPTRVNWRGGHTASAGQRLLRLTQDRDCVTLA